MQHLAAGVVQRTSRLQVARRQQQRQEQSWHPLAAVAGCWLLSHHEDYEQVPLLLLLGGQRSAAPWGRHELEEDRCNPMLSKMQEPEGCRVTV